MGLARAGALAQAMPSANILVLVVELCGLTFQPDDVSKSNLVATALFGDGAAGAIVSTEGEGLTLSAMGEHTWPDTLDVMGWRVADEGLGVIFAREIPALVLDEFRPALEHFLARNRRHVGEFDSFVCHPGGARVIDALERALDLAQGTLVHVRHVLRDYGNMSAPTVLFVLERALAHGVAGPHLMSALGPGFSAAFLALDRA
jgi:alkylresorcinol/alkylpyrone synthase